MNGAGVETRLLRVGGAILFFVLLGATLLYAWRGWYARYITDDYCTASQVRTRGYVEAMQFHRSIWSGRFSFFAVKGALEIIGTVTARVVPAALMLLLGCAAASSMHRLTQARSRLVIATVAVAVVFAAVNASPSLENIGGSWYWETGSITYTLPLVLLTAWVGLLAWRGSTAAACVASAVLLFVAGGFSETSAAAQAVVCGGVLALCLWSRSRRGSLIAGCGFIATLAALIVMASAPGNAVRAAAQSVAAPPLETLMRTASYAYRFIGYHIFPNILSYVPVMVAGAWIGRSTLVRSRDAAAALLIALAAYIAAFVPTAWLVPAGPAERTLDVPHIMVIAAAFSAALLFGERIRAMRSEIFAVAMLVVALIPAAAFVRTARALPAARANAARHDALERSFVTQRGKNAVVHARWAVATSILGPEPEYWSNLCVSRYYGLQSLRVLP